MMWKTCLILLLVASVLTVGAERHRSYNLVEAWSHLLEDTEKVLDNMLQTGGEAGEQKQEPCEGCDEAERLHALRMQFVQNQILSKLRLRTRPAPLPGEESLPAPVMAGHTLLGPAEAMPPSQYHDEEEHAEDYYGKTDQKIIFPDDDARVDRCSDKRHPTACFSFTMPGDLQPQDVSSAELWMYKEPDPQDGFKQTLVVFEAAHWDQNQLHIKKRPLAIVETDIGEGWVKAEVGWACGSWLEVGRGTLAVSCPSCAPVRRAPSWPTPPGSPGATGLRHPLALRGARRPFLVVNTRHSGKKRRVRQLECTEGMSECCRERLNVSFVELGWSDWILQPSGYQAYFCRGTCTSLAAVTLAGSHHHSVIKKLFHVSGSRRMELKPCCTPTNFSSLNLFYRDTNSTVTQSTLPNMIVESCGCM